MSVLPTELGKYNNYPDLRYRGNNEWSAGHPGCPAGPSASKVSDRLRIFEALPSRSAGAWCRRCQQYEWADNKQKADPIRQDQLRTVQKALVQQETERLRSKIDQLNERAYWRGYHDAMSDSERGYWRTEGIEDPLQDYFQLGFTTAWEWDFGDEQFTSAAMTIPVFEQGWQAINVQYRIVDPPEGVGRYRFTAGLPSPLYLTDPESGIGGRVLLVEGAKKAIVCYAHVGHEFDGVIALPSKMPSTELLTRLQDADEVYIALDPDAYIGDRPAANRCVNYIGAEKCWVVKSPVKPDDLFVKYGGTAKDFMNIVSLARKVT